MAEAFVGTFKRNYLGDADLHDAETVLALLGGWFDDDNALASHSALGMRSSRDYRALMLTSALDVAPAVDRESVQGVLQIREENLPRVVRAPSKGGGRIAGRDETRTENVNRASAPQSSERSR